MNIRVKKIFAREFLMLILLCLLTLIVYAFFYFSNQSKKKDLKDAQVQIGKYSNLIKNSSQLSRIKEEKINNKKQLVRKSGDKFFIKLYHLVYEEKNNSKALEFLKEIGWGES